ncbi:hypothetical protein [Streptomyces sp. NBC_01426]|uniref:hypothetical protein n=1 Tax=Streptomyces sp. NBC_01426 TaxID=2975866 RepID=UPI003FCE46FE
MYRASQPLPGLFRLFGRSFNGTEQPTGAIYDDGWDTPTANIRIGYAPPLDALAKHGIQFEAAPRIAGSSSPCTR